MTNPSISFPEVAILPCEKSENMSPCEQCVLSNFSVGGNFFHCLGIVAQLNQNFQVWVFFQLILQLIFSIFQTKGKMLTHMSALLGIKQAIWGQLSEFFSRRFVCFCFVLRDFMKHNRVLVKNNLILHGLLKA